MTNHREIDLSDPKVVQAIVDDATKVTRYEQTKRIKERHKMTNEELWELFTLTPEYKAMNNASTALMVADRKAKEALETANRTIELADATPEFQAWLDQTH